MSDDPDTFYIFFIFLYGFKINAIRVICCPYINFCGKYNFRSYLLKRKKTSIKNVHQISILHSSPSMDSSLCQKGQFAVLWITICGFLKQSRLSPQNRSKKLNCREIRNKKFIYSFKRQPHKALRF
jgi:hypothetical protein